MIIKKHAKRYKMKINKSWLEELFLMRTYEYFEAKHHQFTDEGDFEKWVSHNLVKDHYRQCYMLSLCHPAVAQLRFTGYYVLGEKLYRSIRADIYIPSERSVIELKCVGTITTKLIEDLEKQMIDYVKVKGVKNVFGFIYQKEPERFLSGKLTSGKWKMIWDIDCETGEGVPKCTTLK